MEELIHKDERLDDLQLNGLQIIQNPNGYCFTSDAVALANFVKCKPHSNVVELCSGSGVIGILINAKNIADKVVFVEIQENLADMSRRSVLYNHLESKFQILNRELQNVSECLKDQRIDVVVCNPPYKKENTSSLLSANKEKLIARHEVKVTLEEIVFEASKLLKFGGKFYICNKEERLVEMINLCSKYKLETKRIKILPSEKKSHIVLIEAVKGGKNGCLIEIAK